MGNENKSTIDKLMELKSLYESGVISKEEMEVMKQRIISSKSSILSETQEIDSADSAPLSNSDINNETQDDEDISFANDENSFADFSDGETEGMTENCIDRDVDTATENIGEEIDKNEIGSKGNKKRKFYLISSVVILAIVLICVLAPPNYSKKLEKAIGKYESKGAKILSKPLYLTDKNSLYLIFKLGDTIYYDGFERRKSAQAILPRKEGLYIKKRTMYFNLDSEPELISKIANNGRKTTFDINNLNCVCGFDGYESVCLKSMKDDRVVESFYYSLSNPDTLFSFEGDLEQNGANSYLYRYETFADVMNQHWSYTEFSYSDYQFEISMDFSNVDMHFCGFGHFIFDKDDYPYEEIEERLGEGTNLPNNRVLYPASWFGTSKMDTFIDCLDEDIERKEEERIYNEIIEQTVKFSDMYQCFSNNSVTAKQLYPSGKEMFLMVRASGVKQYDNEGYKYVVCTNNSYHNACLHTNDESFLNIT